MTDTAFQLEELTLFLQANKLNKIVFAGVGNADRSDDYLGVALALELQNNFNGLAVVNCQDMPENYLGKISAHSPQIVIFLDSVYKKAVPGEILFLEHTEIASAGASTHGMSLAMIAEYLIAMTGCKVFLLGIIPKNLTFGRGLSFEAQKAIELIINILKKDFENA